MVIDEQLNEQIINEKAIEKIDNCINQQSVVELENELSDSINENHSGVGITAEGNDGDSEKVSESITLNTGNYVIKVNKGSTDYFKFMEEMYKLRDNKELTMKEKNARLRDILDKKHKK
jgi:hypothetical protein